MDSVFYSDGLRFGCIRCSKCCRHEPGFVFLSKADVKRLSTGLQIEERELLETYCRRVHLGGFSQLSLKEKENYDCIFWGDGGCTVYEHRPLQCRAYPFWAKNLGDREAWDAESKECPGIGSGPLHSREEIDRWLAARLENPPI